MSYLITSNNMISFELVYKPCKSSYLKVNFYGAMFREENEAGVGKKIQQINFEIEVHHYVRARLV